MTMMAPPPPLDEDEEMLVPNSDYPYGIHTMEPAQSESVSTVENQPTEEPPLFKFTWRIEHLSRLNVKKHYSDVFIVGGYKWRVLIFLEANDEDHLAIYLDVADSATLPDGWSRDAYFSLAIVNQISHKLTIKKEKQRQFNAQKSVRGFRAFMHLSDVYYPQGGYVIDNTLIVEAEFIERRVPDYWAYYSKKQTGFVGLENQEETRYMNSLLQTLYHIPYFRKAVYHMPTTENDTSSKSISLTLQSLFYKLQYSDTSVSTKDLTKSFGWETCDFKQHDVQELNRVLCEKLEDKMKGTAVEDTIKRLFEGHHMNYIESINVDYKSLPKESFYDLQLDVKGCRDVYASFDKYVEVKRLDHAEQYHSLRWLDKRKSVLFLDFPPVLQLQLKRFEYDFMQRTMVKINDRYEFPLQLDLDRDNGKYLSPHADRSVRNLYTLHSVLVHSGGVDGGHYYAFIRPTLSDQWYKFEDECVTKEEVERALEGQYGGEDEVNVVYRHLLRTVNLMLNCCALLKELFGLERIEFGKEYNPYMLVYIRESDRDKIICNVDEKDIAEDLRVRLKKKQEEKENKPKEKKPKEKTEAYCFTNIETVHFRRLDKPKEDDFCLELSLLDPYDDVVKRVANQLGLDDPSKLRLTSHDCYSQQPKPQPIKHRGVDCLSDMLEHYYQSSDILYYEVLDIPLPELQGLKSLKVTFHHAMKDKISVHVIRLPKDSTVGDVLNELKTKVELSNPNAELRLLEVFYHKINKIFYIDKKIENINDQYWTLRAEEIPEEERNLSPGDRLIHVYHFNKDSSENHMIQNFGEPFFFVIHEGEILSEVKERIKEKLQVPDEEFAEWNFAFVSLGPPEYLQDTDIVSHRFQRRDVHGGWEQCLGLEHSDNTSKRIHQVSQNRHSFERSVRIYN